MKINTRFELRDEIYFIHNNVLKKGSVKKITAAVQWPDPREAPKIIINYVVEIHKDEIDVVETDAFATVKEAAKSLVTEYEKGLWWQK